MKKLIAILLCTVMLAGMTASIAMGESRFCPYCGQEYPGRVIRDFHRFLKRLLYPVVPDDALYDEPK